MAAEFSQAQRDAISTAELVASALSITGSLLILWAAGVLGRGGGGGSGKAKARRLASTGDGGRPGMRTHLVLCMSAGDVVSSATLAVGSVAALSGATVEGGWCTLQAFVLEASFMMVNLWTTMLAVEFRGRVRRNRSLLRHRRRVHAFVVGASLAISSVPLLVPGWAGYGEGGVTCFITRDHGLARQVLFYIPLYIMIALVTLMYLDVVFYVRQHSKLTESLLGADAAAQRLRQGHKMALYPIAFVLVWLPSIVNRLRELFDDSPEFGLSLASAATFPAQGFANCLIYGALTKRVRLLCPVWTSPGPGLESSAASSPLLGGGGGGGGRGRAS